MTRLTMLAIVVALGACSKGERDQLSRSASDSAAVVDTAMRADTTAAAAQPETATSETRSKPARSGASVSAPEKAPARTDARRDRGPTGAEALTGVRAAPAPATLSANQVKRLQAALNRAGCNAGTPDGVEGAGTRRAIDCGLKKYKLASNDLSGLYRKLGLDF